MNKPTKLVIRCSELSKIMTKGKTKGMPSEGTKTFLMTKAKEDFYGIKTFVGNKYTEKGIQNEDLGIEMVNQIRFMDFTKNQERKTLDWITGECDINTHDSIIDIKCPWSFDTFPVFQEEADKNVKKSGYDWQLRGYMLLYNKPMAEIIYCLTTTPSDLLGFSDNIELHDVEHINIENRITCVKIERDEKKEEEMKTQYEIANKYYQECITELQNKTQKQESWI